MRKTITLFLLAIMISANLTFGINGDTTTKILTIGLDVCVCLLIGILYWDEVKELLKEKE